MTETETPSPPDAPAPPAEEKSITLSTKVDQEFYEWFEAHAKENFRNLSGQLAFVLHDYRKRTERLELVNDMAEAISRGTSQRPIPWGKPYVGEIPPGVTVRWDAPTGEASVPERPVPIEDNPDDPEEGVH